MIISSECLIWTVVKLIILVRMAYIIDRLVSRCARSIVTFYIGLHEVCVRVGRRTLHHNQISRMDRLPNFVTYQGVETCVVERSSCDARVWALPGQLALSFPLQKKDGGRK